jgi:hypothetical protein
VSCWRLLLACRLNDGGLELFRVCTGRATAPVAACHYLWLVCGRRGGKSFTMALVAAYLACFKDWKVHPYMFGAVIVDDPQTDGLDFGAELQLIAGAKIPTSSDGQGGRWELRIKHGRCSQRALKR